MEFDCDKYACLECCGQVKKGEAAGKGSRRGSTKEVVWDTENRMGAQPLLKKAVRSGGT